MSPMFTDPSDSIKSHLNSVTNRAGLTPTSGVPALAVGVDTVRVRLPYKQHGLSERRTAERLNRPTGVLELRSASAHEVLPEAGVALLADDRFGRFITFEFSVPRLLTGSYVVAATTADALTAVRKVYDEATQIVDWDSEWDQADLRRVDIVRDVRDVTDIPGLLDRLAVLPQTRGRLRERYNDPKRGRAETLRVGTPKRWAVSAYDKFAEQTNAASRARDPHQRRRHLQNAERARGQLRVEVSVRADPLRERHGTNSLTNLMKENIMRQDARHYFDAARLGTPVGGSSKVEAALDRMALVPAHEKMSDRMLGMLMLASLGRPQGASRNCVDKHLRLARDYGLTPADLVRADRNSVRIDWESGFVREDVA